MKICIHDYGGYAFTRQLAESLAKRGHSVQYVYSDTTQAIKRVAQHAELPNLQVTPIVLQKGFNKYSMLQRRAGEIEHGKKAAEEINQFQPEVMLSADAPLDAQQLILKACNKQKMKFVFWLQDAIGLATYRILSQKIPIAGALIGSYYEKLERRMVRQSDRVIVIAEDFLALMKQWKVPDEKIHVIQNWAPINELPIQPKKNPWSVKMGLEDKFCFLYSGILGYKHSPDLFIHLAGEFQSSPDIKVVVVAEGEAAQWLRQEKEDRQLNNLVLLPYQPAEEFAQVLGAGDVLMSILNTDAGTYSVPSKVLSYLCAQRPILLSMPPENLAARIISENHAGLISSPNETDKWLRNAKFMYEDRNIREKMAENARSYAEKNFDIEQITDKFEGIMVALWKN